MAINQSTIFTTKYWQIIWSLTLKLIKSNQLINYHNGLQPAVSRPARSWVHIPSRNTRRSTPSAPVEEKNLEEKIRKCREIWFLEKQSSKIKFFPKVSTKIFFDVFFHPNFYFVNKEKKKKKLGRSKSRMSSRRCTSRCSCSRRIRWTSKLKVQ